jgi:hypothetical protein
MEGTIKGIVVKSLKDKPENKFFSTVIYQHDSDKMPIEVATMEAYKPGQAFDCLCRISVSLFNGKAYLRAYKLDAAIPPVGK